MVGRGLVEVAGFPLALGRLYHAESHMWVVVSGPDRVVIGMDALGVETSGSLAQVSFLPIGTAVAAGRPFGQLEAAKLVGPLLCPVSGTVVVTNEQVALDAALLERDPYGEGWLIEATLSGNERELSGLLVDPEEIKAWFAAKIADYKLKGVLAE
jgi:glycine cleavage system H protein